jgi:hypothetical protein
MLPPEFRARFPSLKLIKGLIYYRWRIGGRERYQRLPSPDNPDFEAAYRSAVAAKRPARPADPQLLAMSVRRWNARQVEGGNEDRTIPAWLVTLAREARKRAKRRGLPFTLSRDQLSLLARRADGCCEVTRIPFRHEAHEGSAWRPFAPSLDRLSNAGGYTLDNVRLTSVIVNTAMNQWGEEAFWIMIRAASLQDRGELGS